MTLSNNLHTKIIRNCSSILGSSTLSLELAVTKASSPPPFTAHNGSLLPPQIDRSPATDSNP
ncbi:hypothetical protein C5167_043795 [Papaver somniferum]|uniref:Uncharacterized protein n=1 Tax=Papaver somniferum TaxID=3469 RepID=A0A4Y7L9N8_PAPSO|nr:hypothetical protein C5167_043795 [Papaver somniferum]